MGHSALIQDLFCEFYILLSYFNFRGSSGSRSAEWRPWVGGGRGEARLRLSAPSAWGAGGAPWTWGSSSASAPRASDRGRGRGADEQETHSQTRHQAAPGQSKALHLSFLSKEPH